MKKFTKEEERILKQCENCKHYVEPGAYWDNPSCKIGKIPDCPDDDYPYFEERQEGAS